MLREFGMGSKKVRDVSFDIARALGMLGVIVGHTLMGGQLTFTQNLVFEMNLPIFFFVSGYFFRKKTITSTINSGINTLIIPYLIGSLIWIGFNFIKYPDLETVRNFTIASIYAAGSQGQTLFGNGNYYIGALWFLPAMFISTLLFQIIMRLKKQITKIILILGLFVLGAYLGKQYVLPFSIAAVLEVQVFYLAGYLWRSYHSKVQENRRVYYCFLLTNLFIWVIGARSGWYGLNGGVAANIWLATLGGLGTCFVLLYIAKLIGNYATHLTRYLKWVGQFSLLFLFFNWFDITFLNEIIITNLQSPLTNIVNDSFARVITATLRICWSSIIVFGALKMNIVNRLFISRDYPIKNI